MEKDQAKGAGVQGRSLRDRLGQWESRLAPLSDKQKDGFMELSSAATFRPLPAEVSHFAHVQYLFLVLFPDSISRPALHGGKLIFLNEWS